jgi:quinol monooxygenase YgiN
MSLRVIITMRAKPGRGGELLELMDRRGVGVRQEPGCEDFEIFRSGSDPDHLCLLELWTDRAALDAHAAANLVTPGNSAIANARADVAMMREDYDYLVIETMPRPVTT